MAGFRQVYTVQTEFSAHLSFFGTGFREHIQGEHDILEHRHAVKQRRALEKHSHFFPENLQVFFIHQRKVTTVIQDLSTVRTHQSDDVLDHYSFS